MRAALHVSFQRRDCFIESKRICHCLLPIIIICLVQNLGSLRQAVCKPSRGTITHVVDVSGLVFVITSRGRRADVETFSSTFHHWYQYPCDVSLEASRVSSSLAPGRQYRQEIQLRFS